MENVTRPPLLSNADLGYVKDTHTPEQVRDIYEAARAKDAELIQQLLDALEQSRRDGRGALSITMLDAIDAAAAAGFKPSKP